MGIETNHKRLCFYNPHTVLGKTLFSVLFKTRTNAKYDFLLTYLKDNNYHVAIVNDGTATSITAGSTSMEWFTKLRFLLFIWSKIEIRIWGLINGIPLSQLNIISRPDKLNQDSDILFGFGILTDTFLYDSTSERSILKQFKGKKILHASHIYGRASRMSNNLQKTGVQEMAAEANLIDSAFISKHYPYINKFHILPFVLGNRFKSIKPFRERESKCLAIGTLVEFNDINDDNKDYVDFYKIKTLQPIRKELYEKRKDISMSIECKIFPNSTGKEKYKVSKLFSLLSSSVKIKSNPYLSFDIVEEYNKYQMFVAPEEAIGLPSVNFIEGMACGCAFIGLKSSMYTDYGLKDKVHYIGYDGTIKDLLEKIEYYKTHQKELQSIATEGQKFVSDKFSLKKILKSFWTEITQ